MRVIEYLKKNHSDLRIQLPTNKSELQVNQVYVYCLEFNNKVITVGAGKLNRAMVIFDSTTTCTNNHIKAFHIRVFHLISKSEDVFTRIVIPVNSKKHALEMEHLIHKNCGGQGGADFKILENMMNDLIPDDPKAKLFIKIAFYSAYSGFRDLRKWRNEGLIPDQVWKNIRCVLRLDQLTSHKGWQ